VVHLYHDLERALRAVNDQQLAELASTARAGERALGRWARTVEAFRGFKRRLDAGLPPLDELRDTPAIRFDTEPLWIEDDDVDAGTPPYLWEALAFAIGFIVSFLVI